MITLYLSMRYAEKSRNILGTTLHAFNAMLLIHSRTSCVFVYLYVMCVTVIVALPSRIARHTPVQGIPRPRADFPLRPEFRYSPSPIR
jgi:hypothetical protein